VKRITEVEILGEPHSVKYKKIKHYGIYKFGELTIKSDDRGRSQMRTIVHEMGHGYYEQTRDPDGTCAEEDFGRLFELGVVDLVKNNWEVVKRLKEEVGG
jgi:hypothetical protein